MNGCKGAVDVPFAFGNLSFVASQLQSPQSLNFDDDRKSNFAFMLQSGVKLTALLFSSKKTLCPVSFKCQAVGFLS